jgi:hypothetical protein
MTKLLQTITLYLVKTPMELDRYREGNTATGNSIQLSNKATVKIATQIALYMPPSISVQYNSKYGDQNIGPLAAAGKGALDAFAGKMVQILTPLLGVYWVRAERV